MSLDHVSGRLHGSFSAEDFARVEEVFAAAVTLAGEARLHVLDEACCGRPDLREEVLSLLAAHDSLGCDPPSSDGESGAHPVRIGSQIGAYRLVEKIGEGGMGEVYRAERADGAFVQQVAVKITRSSIVQVDLVRRVRNERQILASLRHANIVTLLDGGTTLDGQAYLVMEFVEGTPITRYCRDRALSLEERLQIVRVVCGAVQHAHQHGVVHRDLKPANILIGADGAPKVLDFGVAKLLESRADDGVGTAGIFPGPLTPNYASPEQLRGMPVTTASDVYALGVLLYEVLTGVRPYETHGEALDRVIELVVRATPVRPSGAPRDAVPQRYARKRLRGDLDAIVLKAMSKDPKDRYDSAGEFASDIARFLDGEPVLARAPAAGYVLRRLAARNKTVVTVSAVALSAILATLGVALRQAGIARDERDRARAEAARAEQTAGFLAGVFQSANPAAVQGQVVTARDLLDRGTASISRDLNDQPDVQASLLITMADAYDRLGFEPKALELSERSLALREGLTPPDGLAVAESLHRVGRLHRRQGRPARAVPLLERAVGLRETLLGPVHRDVSATLRELALALRETGDLTRPRQMFDRAIAIEEIIAPQSATLALLYNNVGNELKVLGDFPAARAAFERSIAIYERTKGADRWGIAMPLLSYGMLHREQEEVAAARPLFERAMRTADETFGAESLSSAYALARLGDLAHAEGDRASAESQLERSLAMHERLAAPDHPETATVLLYLGRLRLTEGRSREAVRLLERALRIREKIHDEHPRVAETLVDLARAYRVTKEPAAASKLLRRALTIQRRFLPQGHPSFVATLTALGELSLGAGHRAEAIRLLEEAAAVARDRWPASHSLRREAEDALRSAQGVNTSFERPDTARARRRPRA